MSGLPPNLNAETGTPAHEWAQSTTTAAFARDDPAPANSVAPPGVQGTQSQATSTATTPAFPGAYPPENTGPINTQAISDAASSAAKTLASTATQVVPTAKSALASVTSYIPTNTNVLGSTGASYGDNARASTNDGMHKTSLPSTEVTGALPQDHVGGAGALPGTVAEEGVGRLPDERDTQSNDPSIYPASTVYPSIAPSDVLVPVPAIPATTESTNPFLQTNADTQQHPQETAVKPRTSLPTWEVVGQQPQTHQDGVGALPGTQREAGVAVLPDETGGAPGATNATSSATGTHPRDYAMAGGVGVAEEEGNESLGAGERRIGREAVGGVGALVGGKDEEGVAVLPDERGQAEPAVTEGQKGDKVGEMDQAEKEERKKGKGTETKSEGAGAATVHKGQPNEGDGYGVDYHPAELHPPPPEFAVDKSHAREGGGESAPSQPSQERAQSAQQSPGGGGGEKTRKAGFLDKMKGEAKVLIGKMEGKKGAEKVQEGKKLIAGDSEA